MSSEKFWTYINAIELEVFGSIWALIEGSKFCATWSKY